MILPFYSYDPWHTNPQRWERCMRDAGAQMIAQGWNKHARKFYEVQRRKATKLFRSAA